MSILDRVSRKVKPARVSDRPSAPFGAGILRSIPTYRTDHTIDDERWYAMMSAEPSELPDAEWDRLAAQAEWEARYEMGLTGEDRCAACGRVATGELTSSLCDACVWRIDMNIEPTACAACRRQDDFIDPETALCPPCLRAAEEATTACENRAAMGQYRVF